MVFGTIFKAGAVAAASTLGFLGVVDAYTSARGTGRKNRRAVRKEYLKTMKQAAKAQVRFAETQTKKAERCANKLAQRANKLGKKAKKILGKKARLRLEREAYRVIRDAKTQEARPSAPRARKTPPTAIPRNPRHPDVESESETMTDEQASVFMALSNLTEAAKRQGVVVTPTMVAAALNHLSSEA